MKIEHVRSLQEANNMSKSELKPATSKIRKCIYKNNEPCTAPDKLMSICMTCPYNHMLSLKDLLKLFFKKTVGIAIDLLNKENSKRPLDRITPSERTETVSGTDNGVGAGTGGASGGGGAAGGGASS